MRSQWSYGLHRCIVAGSLCAPLNPVFFVMFSSSLRHRLSVRQPVACNALYRSMATMRNPDGAWGRYNALVKAGDLMPDEHQERIIRLLDDLQRRIVSWDAEIKGASTGARSSGAMMGLMDWFRADRGSARQVIPPPRGVYMYGGVGCGKTMLMDLFHESLPLTEKRRVHFHSFMLEVHDRCAPRHIASSGAHRLSSVH